MMSENLSFNNRGSIYEATHEDSSYPEVTLPYLSFASISTTVSNVLLVTTLVYLKNLSLAKQCLLLCLYKDLVALWICMNSLCEIRMILSYSTGNGHGIDNVLSVVLSFCLWCLIGLSLLLMNVTAALKLYINKTNTLDPQMPWGDDEKIGMNCIRVTCTILIVGFTSVLYGLGIYPKIYYLFSGIESPNSFGQPRAATIFPVMLLILVASGMVTYLCAKFYKSRSLQLNETPIPKQLNYLVWVPMIAVSLTLCSSALDILSVTNHWKLLRLNIAVLQLGTPTTIIMRTPDLKAYFGKCVRRKLDQLFFMQIYWTPALISLFMYGTIYLFQQN